VQTLTGKILSPWAPKPSLQKAILDSKTSHIQESSQCSTGREREREGGRERKREREREREINGKEQRTQYAQMIFLTKVKRNSIGEGKPFNKQS